MKIINPIYDNAFKYLMDNEQIAKIVLSIILDIKVISLQSKPQETPLVAGSINMSRFDFKAIIQKQSGESRTVLIELQKYKNPDPILRFRQYLAKNYIKEETIINSKGKEETLALPIITIYILGFDLPEYNCRAIRVDNKPFDIVGQKDLPDKNEFIELLTHQSFILIAVEKENIEKQNTRLEKFLNLFIQKLKGEASNPIIDVEVDTDNDPELEAIVDYLNNATLDEELVRRIDAEKQHFKGIASLEKQIEEAKAREEEAKAREEEARAREEEARAREEEARAREEEERRQKEAAKTSVENTKIEMAKMMLQYGESVDRIAQQTGLSQKIIEKLKN